MNLPIYHSINNSDLVPCCSMNIKAYLSFAHLFEENPTTLERTEELIKTITKDTFTVDFTSDNPININDYQENVSYTTVHDDYFPVNISIQLPAITPHERYYSTLIIWEAKRIRLHLFNFIQVIKDDIQARAEITETLKQIARCAADAAEILEKKIHPDLSLNYDEYPPEYEIVVSATNNIYRFLFTYLTKLYYELVIVFDDIIKRDDYLSISDFYNKILDQFPKDIPLKQYYDRATLIHKAQKAIINNRSQQENTTLLTEIYKTIEFFPKDETLKTVTTALENYVYIQQTGLPIPTFEQLIELKYANTIFRNAKSDINNQILSLTNPREMLLKLEEIIDEQIILPAQNSNTPSISQRLNEWLQKQHKICEDNIAQAFIPVSATAKTSTNIKSKQLQANVSKLKTLAHKRLDFLSGCNLSGEKIMSDKDYISLLGYIDEFITNGQIPQNITKIKTNTTIEYLRYTFYLIYKDLKNPTRAEWINLLHAIFFQFINTETSTTTKKFSTPPHLYEDDIKTIINNKQ